MFHKNKSRSQVFLNKDILLVEGKSSCPIPIGRCANQSICQSGINPTHFVCCLETHWRWTMKKIIFVVLSYTKLTKENLWAEQQNIFAKFIWTVLNKVQSELKTIELNLSHLKQKNFWYLAC